MKIIRNSYFKAISEATCKATFPEYGDLWRIYHSTSPMTDSDYYRVEHPSLGVEPASFVCEFV